MRIATWNVNSARARIDRILSYLARRDIDVLALQETKVRDDAFPLTGLAELGYEVAHWGIDGYNGVAIASRVGLTDVERGFPGQPEWIKPGQPPVLEPRALGATCGPVRVWSLYVPHGRGLDDPHMAYKLAWLQALRSAAAPWLPGNSQAAADAAGPDSRTAAADAARNRPAGRADDAVALVGDWNVAPLDTDVWDIAAFAGATHVSAPEREAFAAFAVDGWREVTREHIAEPGRYTYWDYQQLRFPRDEGLRIDFAYCSPALASRVSSVEIVRDERRGKGASDHVPVEINLT